MNFAVIPLLLATGLVSSPDARSQASPSAVQAVQAAVNAELAANNTDKSVWMYRDHDVNPGKDITYQTVETPEGTVKRALSQDGHPLTGEERDAETERIEKAVNDKASMARQRKAGAHDDAQAEEMLRMMPVAFLWTIRSETSEFITLDFKPNPEFNAPDMQSRVMGAMQGEMMIARNGNRIRTLRGALAGDVKIGFGLLGKLNRGGTFQVERREVAPGKWQITETHVHIGGHALLFKTIGQQEDEVKTDWKPSPAKNLQQAAEALRSVK